ncbi:MAG: hypothetical protein Q4D14_07765 [Bacteroidales bacterium]|nr:hypothetical protein [Bacteroidales bacterium]
MKLFTLKRFFVVTLLMCLGISQSWAWTRASTVIAIASTNNSSKNGVGNDVGGTVCVNNQNTAREYQAKDQISTGISGVGNTGLFSGSVIQYFFAQEKEGFKFVGWSESEDGSNIVSTESVYANTNTSNNQDVSKTLYAIFRSDKYLRNRETGRFLMNGGTNSTHAVVGNYAKVSVGLANYSEAEYFSTTIATQYGYLANDANLNGASTEWNFTKNDKGFYTITNSGKALTAAGTYFHDNPLYQYVGTAALDATDKNQQWEIVTEDMLIDEMKKATPENPMNVTHLIKNPNFDKVDGTTGWTFNGNGNTSRGRVTNVGVNGTDDNTCNYNWRVNTAKVGTSSENQWDCYQVLTVRPGHYFVTNQGVLNGVTNCIYFYAWSNPEGSYVEKTQLMPSGNITSQDAASTAFNNNSYCNKLTIKVGTDGVLVIGVKKTEKNSTSGSTFFDNFQLYYLGTTDPGHDYDYDVIGSTRKATVEGEKVTLTGTWREVDMKAVAGPATGDLEDGKGNLKSVIDNNSALVVDATNATLVCRPEVQSTNPNVLILANDAKAVGNDVNVIVGDESANLDIHDDYNFAASEIDNVKAATVSVNRSFKGGSWNTFCVPFDMTISALTEALGKDNVVDIKKLAGAEDADKDGSYTLKFDNAEEINAGESYLVWITNDISKENFKVSGANVTLTATPEASGDFDVVFQGTYNKRLAPKGSYIISNNNFYCVDSDVNVKAFRGWFEIPGEAGEGSALNIVFDDEDVTGITSVSNGNANGNDNLYNIAGQRVNENAKGIIIKNGKKYLVK